MNKLKFLLKYFIEFIFNLGNFLTLKSSTEGRILLFLSPQYLNYGDHAIAFSEIVNLKKLFSGKKVLDVNFSFFKHWPDRVKKIVGPADIIVITGGGYMGNLWPDNHQLAECVLECFPNNRIIFAPQTIFYKETESSDKEKADFAMKLHQHGNFFFYGRDEQSCLLMKELGFVRGENYDLMPDFVLLLPQIFNLKYQRKTIALCLRDDNEGQEGLKARISATMNEITDYPLYTIFMARAHVEIPTFLREKILKRKMQEYANANIVITDRLHGMIFSAYTGTPCIAFDNISKKVSGVYEWIKELDYIVIAENEQQIPELYNRIKDKSKSKNLEEFVEVQRKLSNDYLLRFIERMS